MRSPLDVSYQDLIDAAEKKLKWMHQSYPGMKRQGTITEWTATHNIAVQEKLLKLLKTHRKDPQLNMQELFQKLK